MWLSKTENLIFCGKKKTLVQISWGSKKNETGDNISKTSRCLNLLWPSKNARWILWRKMGEVKSFGFLKLEGWIDWTENNWNDSEISMKETCLTRVLKILFLGAFKGNLGHLLNSSWRTSLNKCPEMVGPGFFSGHFRTLAKFQWNPHFQPGHCL